MSVTKKYLKFIHLHNMYKTEYVTLPFYKK